MKVNRIYTYDFVLLKKPLSLYEQYILKQPCYEEALYTFNTLLYLNNKHTAFETYPFESIYEFVYVYLSIVEYREKYTIAKEIGTNSIYIDTMLNVVLRYKDSEEDFAYSIYNHIKKYKGPRWYKAITIDNLSSYISYVSKTKKYKKYIGELLKRWNS